MSDDRKAIRDWLQAELQRKGHGAKGKLAEYLGIRPDGITRMLNTEPGKETREIKAGELVKMGEFFGSNPPGVAANSNDLRPVTSKPQYVKVIGRVAANTWLDVDEMDFGYEDMYSVPSLGNYPGEWQFGLVVDGNCLNKIANNGDVLVCLNLITAPEEVNENDLVIVERKRFGGQMVERTAKRMRRTTHGYELWPESTDPQHQEPILLHRRDGDEEVSIIGKVLWIMRKP